MIDKREKPNVILITADQLRADALGFENDQVITPNLNFLAQKGTTFNFSYCMSPVCTPSRASIFTGRYPQNTGAWNIGVPMNEDEVTLSDHLRNVGYHTAAIGKMHFRPQCKPGFTNLPESVSVRDQSRKDGTFFGFERTHITEDNKVGEYLEFVQNKAPEWSQSLGKPDHVKGDVWVSEMPLEFHQTHWIGEHSIDVIHKHDAKQPLFMWVSFVDPHHPFNPPKKYRDMYDNLEISIQKVKNGELDLRPNHLRRQGDNGYWPGGGEEVNHSDQEWAELIRNYYAMITFIDDEIGRIIEALKSKGGLDNTIIIFTSDHGELLGDHGLLYKGPWFYEGLIRVPLIFMGPNILSGHKTDALVEGVDILPTILELIGETIPYGIQGQSQKNVLTGSDSSVRTSAVVSYDAHDRGINAKCLRTEGYKLVIFGDSDYGELFDIKNDPNEFHNVYFDSNYEQVKLHLIEVLVKRLITDQDPLPERHSLW